MRFGGQTGIFTHSPSAVHERPPVSGMLPPYDASPGDDPLVGDLFTDVYRELRRLAHRVRGGRAGETLNTTALVHEVYLKLVASGSLHIKSRAHFMSVAARAMRQILVDTARSQLAQKRGGAALLVSLDESAHAQPMVAQEMLALDEALRKLEDEDPRRARVVEHRLFVGLTPDESADVLGVSRPTVDRDWRAARAWLAVELAESTP